MNSEHDGENMSDESKAFKFGLNAIEKSEPLIADFIRGELDNQRNQLKLIASENFVSEQVLEAMGYISEAAGAVHGDIHAVSAVRDVRWRFAEV